MLSMTMLGVDEIRRGGKGRPGCKKANNIRDTTRTTEDAKWKTIINELPIKNKKTATSLLIEEYQNILDEMQEVFE